ncbi:MAG TPA: O-antigen ligase family protein [Thermoanaerobaculia bacterium]|jgi:O-antigen ligase|nr:O-antigen ligase family protein [Thermoanaerobaculia bacterium]
MATLVVPPFVVVPVALDAFRLPQRMVAEALALASLIALAIGSRRLEAPATGGAWTLRDILRLPALRAALPLLLVAAASFVTTAHPAHVADALPDLAIGAAVLVGWSIGFESTTLRRLLDVALLPAAALAALGILQLHHLWQPVGFAEALAGERLAVTSLAGNPGDLAAMLVLPCLVAQAGLPGSRGWRFWWRLTALALCVYALAGTQTLTSLIAVVLGSLVLWAVLLPRRYVLVGAAATAAAVVLLVVAVRPLRVRVESLVRSASVGAGLNEALSGRLDAWWVAERLLREHPLAGVGFGAYRAEFAAAKLRLMSEGVPFFAGHLNPSFANAHNEYLEVGADLGWPGLLALAWGAALTLRAAWRARDRLPGADRALCWGGLVALALLALAYFPFRLAPVAFPALAFFGWLFANAEGAESEP